MATERKHITPIFHSRAILQINLTSQSMRYEKNNGFSLGIIQQRPVLRSGGWLPAFFAYGALFQKIVKINRCCDKMGGVSYCDRTAGRYVCHNGAYSTCYCTQHAIMDLQTVNGCCLWHEGVLSVTPEKIVLCNDGSVSEECGILNQFVDKTVY